MRDRGGRGARGAWRAAALALLFLGAALGALVPHAASQGPTDPWWGPSDRSHPTDGWAVRVPVVVENPFDHPLPPMLASVDIDFGKLLVEAGWTNQTVGTEARLRGFTLDENSIRIVEYFQGFAGGPKQGVNAPPLVAHWYKAPFEADRYREYDPARHPAGSLLFQLPGVGETNVALKAKEKRYFYVFANPLEFGDAPMAPQEIEKSQSTPFEAFLWGTAGSTVYGLVPNQNGPSQIHLLDIGCRGFGVQCGGGPGGPGFPGGGVPSPVNYAVYVHSLGKFQLLQAANNPGTFTGTVSFSLPPNTKYKIVADKPLLVAQGGGGGSNDPFFAFVPTPEGDFVGRRFLAYAFPGAEIVVPMQARSGSTVQVRGCDGGPHVATLNNVKPDPLVQTGSLVQNGWICLEGDGDFMLSQGMAISAPAVPFQTMQVPSRSGGPVGTEFWGAMPADGGYMKVCPEARTTLRIVRADDPATQVHPSGPTQSTPPALLDPGLACTIIRADSNTPAKTLDVFATKEDRFPVPGAPVPFRLVTGARERANVENTRGATGHYGGPHATDFLVSGPVGIFGVYNDTRIRIYTENRARGEFNVTTSLQADGFCALSANADCLGSPIASHDVSFRIVSEKPIVVVAMDDTSGHGYTRYVPGVPLKLKTSVLKAEFRGPLVELRSPDTESRQLPRSTGPGTPLPVRVDVLNLGRWTGGEGLPDSVRLSCDHPSTWIVDGCDKDINLGPRGAQRLELTITPSPDDVNLTKVVTVHAASKSGGATATFRFIVFVEVRYGVGLWFDVEGGRKTIDPPIGVDPGGSYDYAVVLKNTGSTADTFELEVEDPRPGWTQSLTLDGRPVPTLRLEGGEARTLVFSVRAPDAESAPQNIVRISAQSLSSALAGDVLNSATRIRPNVNIKLTLEPTTRVAAPGEAALFNLTVLNAGNDIFRILLQKDGVLPAGWTSALAIDEIDLGPHEPYTFPLRITPPEGARAGDLATLKISAETDAGGSSRIPGDQVSAVVVVRKIHNLTIPNLPDAQAEPGSILRFVLPLTNHGNGADAVELLPGASTPPWRILSGQPVLNLAVDGQAELPLDIEVPAGTPPGPYNLTFTLRLSREALQNVTIPLVVSTRALVAFEGLEAVRTAPGRATTVGLVAHNRGNVEGVFEFAAQLPPGWNATIAPERARLAPGERVPVTMVFNATRDAPDGEHDVALEARLEGAEAGRTPLPTALARPDLHVADVQSTGRLVPGELVLVSATIGNRGDIHAENVTVALLVDGVAVDQVTLARVSPGESAVATLNWLATRRGGDVRVVVDPQEEIVMQSREGNAAQIPFGSRLGTPAPALAPVLLALFLPALMRRRERA